MKHIVVAVHDVAATTATESIRWLELFESVGVRTVLKIVAGPFEGRPLRSDRQLVETMAAAAERGHELCLHGWAHRAETDPSIRGQLGRLVAGGAEEFWTVSEVDASSRLARGLDELRELGLEPRGFTPPGWLANAATRRAALASGLEYTTDHLGVTLFDPPRRVHALALCFRGGAGTARPSTRAVLGAVRSLAGRAPVVRLAVHPVDQRDPSLVAATVAAVCDVVARGVRPATFAELGAVLA